MGHCGPKSERRRGEDDHHAKHVAHHGRLVGVVKKVCPRHVGTLTERSGQAQRHL